MIRNSLFLTLPILLAATLGAAAADRSTPEQAKALAQEAVAFLKTKGADEAIRTFNDPTGPFVRRDLYVFVFDGNGRYVASGANPRLVGSDASELKDAEGKSLVREMIAQTASKPEAQVDYVWLNRQTNRVEHKHSYVIREGNYIVGSGAYDD